MDDILGILAEAPELDLPEGFNVERTSDDLVVFLTPEGARTLTVDEAGNLGAALIKEALLAKIRRELAP